MDKKATNSNSPLIIPAYKHRKTFLMIAVVIFSVPVLTLLVLLFVQMEQMSNCPTVNDGEVTVQTEATKSPSEFAPTTLLEPSIPQVIKTTSGSNLMTIGNVLTVEYPDGWEVYQNRLYPIFLSERDIQIPSFRYSLHRGNTLIDFVREPYPYKVDLSALFISFDDAIYQVKELAADQNKTITINGEDRVLQAYEVSFYISTPVGDDEWDTMRSNSSTVYFGYVSEYYAVVVQQETKELYQEKNKPDQLQTYPADFAEVQKILETVKVVGY